MSKMSTMLKRSICQQCHICQQYQKCQNCKEFQKCQKCNASVSHKTNFWTCFFNFCWVFPHCLFCLVSLIQLSDFVECKYIVVSFCLLKFSVEGKSLLSSQAPSDLPQCWVLISCSLDKPKMTSCLYNVVFRFHKYWMEIPRNKCWEVTRIGNPQEKMRIPDNGVKQNGSRCRVFRSRAVGHVVSENVSCLHCNSISCDLACW